MKLYKKKWFWAIIILAIVIILIIINSLKGACGFYNFAAPYREDCNCIGIKTDPCSGIIGSCDKGISNCIGLRKECFRIWSANQSKEIVRCK